MDIKITKEDNKTFVAIDGRIDTTTVNQFQEAANELMGDEDHAIEDLESSLLY